MIRRAGISSVLGLNLFLRSRAIISDREESSHAYSECSAPEYSRNRIFSKKIFSDPDILQDDMLSKSNAERLNDNRLQLTRTYKVADPFSLISFQNSLLITT